MSAQRMLFLSVASMLWLGIWLTGFQTIHWLLYLPAVFLLFAAITGICPGLMMWRKLGFK